MFFYVDFGNKKTLFLHIVKQRVFQMHTELDQRIIEEGLFTVENNATVRATAKAFGMSKSTIHKDLTIKLYYIDPKLYIKVKKVLGNNLSTRHIRGGLATKKKYERLYAIRQKK